MKSANNKGTRLWALTLGLFLAAGCVSTGRDFPSDVSWIKKEGTRQKDVNLVLGRPFSVGSSGGIPTWTYAYYYYNVIGKRFHKELKFYWNEDKAVKHYSFSTSFPRDVDQGRTASAGTTKQYQPY